MSEIDIDQLLNVMHQKQASDLYITSGRAASLRGDWGMKEIGDVLTPHEIEDIITSLISDQLKQKFLNEKELNFSIDRGQIGRFRVNIMQQKNNPALVIRRIVHHIPDFETLGLPNSFCDLSLLKRGLILLTGVTASGKSTTLASMLDYRNQREEGHIITIEDPIEYFHTHKKSIISQREVGIDTESYAAALKNSLRQRPDAILIGEIRDREVMEHALNIAETGHLALATLHTTNAYQSLERIINFFPDAQASQIRLNLSLNLKAIISQRLVPSVDNKLVLAQEILFNEGLIRELILNGDTTKIRQVIEENQSIGMQTFDQSLLRLFVDGKITEDVALAYSDMPGDLKIKMDNAKNSMELKSSESFHEIDISGLSILDDN